jgi:hypothetical protein
MGNVEKNATDPRPPGGWSEVWRAAGEESAPIIQSIGGYLPALLSVCGVLASTILFFSGMYLINLSAGRWGASYSGGLDSAAWNGFSNAWDGFANFNDGFAHCAGWCLIGMAFFFGPLLFGIAGILRRLNRAKPDSQREDKSPRAGPTNPNLFPCPECGHHVSRLAKACPKCGQPLPPEPPPVQ